MKQGERVHYETREGVAILTLCGERGNSLSYGAMRELDAAILEARFDETVAVLLITGEGEEYFSSGVGLEMLRTVTPGFREAFAQHASETLRRLEETPKLVLAALNGRALGEGLELALACDLRLARASDAVELGLPGIELGLLPSMGGGQRLVRLVGRTRALRLLVDGEILTAGAAEGIGIVDELLEAEGPEDFRTQAFERARRYTAPGKAARAVGLIKRACQVGATLPMDAALALDRELLGQLVRSQDAREGLLAALESRRPAFQGL